MTLFAVLSAGAKTYLPCNFSIFLFSAFTERLGGCLYKCGCVVKFSILMSTIRKRCIHRFISDLIKDVDHMRISGTELLSVILNPQKTAD